MPTIAPSFQSVLDTIQQVNLMKGDLDDFITFYNPITGEYLGTEQRAAFSKDLTVRACAQATFGMWVDIACYPLSVFASVVLPLGG